MPISPPLKTLSLASVALLWTLSGAKAAEEAIELASYEVTALHFPELAFEVPSSISVIEGDDLGSYSAATIPEVLMSQPGVIVRSLSGTPAQASVDLRGMGTTANQRVLILVDGRRMNRPDLGQINWLQLSPSNVGKIEIHRGGQGVIYGDNAIGGVIKIETITPSEPGGSLGLNIGSDQLYNANLSAETNLKSGGLRINTSFLEHDGYRAHSELSARNLGATLALTLAGWETLSSLQYSEQDSDLPGAVIAYGFPDTPRTAQNETDYVREKNITFDEVVSKSLTDSLDFEINLTLSQRAQETFYYSFTENDLNSLGLSPRFHYTTGPVEWVFGADLGRDKLDVTIYEDESRDVLTNDASLKRETYAGYLHGTYAISESTSLRAGLRQQNVRTSGRSQQAGHTSPDFDDATSRDLQTATLGLNQRFGDSVRVWARYDRLFRYPVIDEIAGYQGFLLDPPFNFELRPEKGHGYEIGAQAEAGDLLFSTSFFLIKLEDEITFYTDPVTFGSRNTNLPATQRKGVEATIRYEGERIRASASWTGLDAEFQDGPNKGATPPLIPRHQVTLSVEVDLHEKLSFGTRAQYLSKQYEDMYLDDDYDQFPNDLKTNLDPYLPASFVVDTFLDVEVNEHISLQLTVTNLFDRDYASYKLSTYDFVNPDADAWYPAPGIGWRLSGRFEW
jgi:iron complex outermembrane receptor protein